MGATPIGRFGLEGAGFDELEPVFGSSMFENVTCLTRRLRKFVDVVQLCWSCRFFPAHERAHISIHTWIEKGLLGLEICIFRVFG